VFSFLKRTFNFSSKVKRQKNCDFYFVIKSRSFKSDFQEKITKHKANFLKISLDNKSNIHSVKKTLDRKKQIIKIIHQESSSDSIDL